MAKKAEEKVGINMVSDTSFTFSYEHYIFKDLIMNTILQDKIDSYSLMKPFKRYENDN